MHNNHNTNEIFEFLITPTLKNISTDDILSNIEKISKIIPNCTTVNDLINDPTNNKPRECVAYDEYIYHNKYTKHEEQKFNFVYDDKTIDFHNNNVKYMFMKLCAWLLNEIERLISRITNQCFAADINKTAKNTYYLYFESFACFENDNIINIGTQIPINIKWKDYGLLSPYDHIKKSIQAKGYILDLVSNKDNPREYYVLTLRIPNKRNRD